MKLTVLTLILCAFALILLSVRVIFSRKHSFLTGHACKSAHTTGKAEKLNDGDNKK